MFAKSIPAYAVHGLRMIAVALALAMAAPSPATADDETDAFHAAVAGAYRHYREAYHYFETGSTDLAGISLDDFIAAWKAIVERYADKPPPGYAKDAAFAATLDLIAGKAASAVGAAPNEALLVLRELRGDFAALRRRSNQVVFSDCIDATNAAFDRLWAL